MLFKKDNLMVSIKNNSIEVKERNYHGRIIGVDIKVDQPTQYGFKDILQLEVEVDTGVTEITKNTSYYISDKEGTRFSKFLDDMKIDRQLDVFDVDELLNMKVEVIIKNNKVADKIYTNIDRIIAI